MCVHPTKSGAKCKREPKQTLCSTHLVNITLVPSKRFPGMMEAPAIGKFFIMNGDDVIAEFIPNPTAEDVAELKRQEAKRPAIMPQLRRQDRNPARRVKCGCCTKAGVTDPYHANIAQVRACYAKHYRVVGIDLDASLDDLIDGTRAMSTYLNMWIEVKKLNLAQTREMINLLAPAKGQEVSIGNVKCIDVDLLEALRYWRDDLVSS
jgi:hypothetical protein